MLSHVQLFVTPCTAARLVSLFITNSQSLLKLMSIESVMSSNNLILCCPLLLLSSIFLYWHQGLFKWVLHTRRPKYWSFKFNSIQDWFPLVLTGWISLLSKGLSRVFSKTTVQRHQFFVTQFSLYSNFCIHIWLLGKNKTKQNIALIRQTLLAK